MKIQILGPLMAQHDGITAVPSARKPRQVLSLMILNSREVVPTSALMTELWNDRPPKSALTTLQTYILQLRKLLAKSLRMDLTEIANGVLQTRNGGYLLALDGAAFDLDAYAALELSGRDALRLGDDCAALGRFDRALELWHGAALADVEHGTLLRAEAARLEQSRLTMIEARVGSKLRLGRHQESLSELAALVLTHSYNENLHAQYMVALHRSGCRARALEIYHRLRRSMIDELGLEPCINLRKLHHAIIAAEPELDDPGAAWPCAAESSVLAAQRGR